MDGYPTTITVRRPADARLLTASFPRAAGMTNPVLGRAPAGGCCGPWSSVTGWGGVVVEMPRSRPAGHAAGGASQGKGAWHGASRFRQVAVTIAAVGLVGCSTSTTPSPPPDSAPAPASASASASGGAAADAGAAGWAGSVCSALLPLVATVKAPPTPNPADQAGTRQAYSAYLGKAVADADQALQMITAAGSPPVAGGDKLAGQLQGQIGQLRAELAQAQTRVEQAAPSDAAGLAAAVAAAGDVVGSLGNTASVVGTIGNDPGLRSAFDQAPSCVQLRAAGGG